MPAARLNADARRSQLLTVAAPLFAERGYHGVSMEELADAAGVTKPVLYQHFGGKRHLYLALVEDAVRDLETQVREALDGTTDNRARVHGAIGAYMDFFGDPLSRLLLGGATPDAGVDEIVATAMHAVTARVARLIAADAGLDEAAALLLSSALRGLATDGGRWYRDHPEFEREEAVRLLARLAWRGLGGFTADTRDGLAAAATTS